jgi:hypothetical protein
MNTYISKLGASLIALALVVAPTTMVLAAVITVNPIVGPTPTNQVVVNQLFRFSASATGGNTSAYTFSWNWGDGSEDSGSINNNGSTVGAHTYTTTGVKTLTLTVSDGVNTEGRTLLINVVNAPVSDLVISNIQKTVTSNTATITWTTNVPGTSRVIYDTVSHSGANGATTGTKPNYDYANTTVIDTNKVTLHTVTLTGLTPNTQYFFRVLSAE